MIELHRAKLMAAGGQGGSSSHNSVPPTSGAASSSSRSSGGSSHQQHSSYHQHPQHHQSNGGRSQHRLSPAQAAEAIQRQEDAQLHRFLHRLQPNWNDSDSMTSTYSSTTPTALTRRLLHRQGAGFLDEAVATVVAGAADRFLVTVLQQAAACRDQRVKGAAVARELRHSRKRHVQQYLQDSMDRSRRREEAEREREQRNIKAVEAGEQLKQQGGDLSAVDLNALLNKPSKKKKKKSDDGDALQNGNLKTGEGIMDDDAASYDSIDREEDYYRNYYGGAGGPGLRSDDEDDEDQNNEEDDTMILRDVARPLASWGMHLDGKLGMEPPKENEFGDSDDDSHVSLPEEKNVNTEGDDADPNAEAQEDGGSDDDADAGDTKPAAKRKTGDGEANKGSGRKSVSPAGRQTPISVTTTATNK